MTPIPLSTTLSPRFPFADSLRFRNPPTTHFNLSRLPSFPPPPLPARRLFFPSPQRFFSFPTNSPFLSTRTRRVLSSKPREFSRFVPISRVTVRNLANSRHTFFVGKPNAMLPSNKRHDLHPLQFETSRGTRLLSSLLVPSCSHHPAHSPPSLTLPPSSPPGFLAISIRAS